MASGKDHIRRQAGTSVLAVAVLMLASMCAQWSFGPAYVWRLHHVRQEMKARILGGLPDDQLTTLHVPAHELGSITWLDGGREVLLNGSLFDIVSVKRTGDGSVEIKAVRDDQEVHVLAELDRDMRLRLGQDAKGKELGTRIISGWAAYCGPFSPVNIPIPPIREREFRDDPHQAQRAPVTVDPEPPRMS